MTELLIIIAQGLPTVDFKIFGAFGVCLTLLLIACGYLIKQITYYRNELKDVRQEKNELQKAREQETKATILALKETKEILKAKLETIDQ